MKRPNPTPEGPEGLGEILSRLFVSRGWGRRQARLHLERAWEAAAGADYAAKTRVLGIKRGVFEVEVMDAVVMQELASFHKRRLLAALRERLANTTLTDLKFRVGT